MFRVTCGRKALPSTRRPWDWPKAYPWSVKKHRLRGGRRDGVDLIVVDNGALRFSIVPTRGMGLWKGWYDGNRLGWDSPVTDGPVHPSLVNLAAAGGLGWLDGFDELLARCGLENNGAPFEVKTVKPDGSESNTTFGLHGKIANIPASYVAVHVDTRAPARDRRRRARRRVSAVRPAGPHGDTNLDCPRLEHARRPRRVRQPQGPAGRDSDPLPLELRSAVSGTWLAVRRTDQVGHAARRAGAGRDRPARSLRRSRAGLDRAGLLSTSCTPGQAGMPRTLAMLRNQAGDKGVVLRFRNDQLPAFTLWKNTGGLRDGYVTGLEPGTNYPNARPFEKAHEPGRDLPVDGRYVAETTLEVLATAEAVAAVEAEIELLQAQGAAAGQLGRPSRSLTDDAGTDITAQADYRA